MGSNCTKSVPHPYKAAPAPANVTESVPSSVPSVGGIEVKECAPLSKERVDVSVVEAYKFGRQLGQGGFAVVREVTDRKTGEPFACKIMKLPGLEEKLASGEFTREDIFKEIDILCGLAHPHILYMKEYFMDKGKVYLITELLRGGELLDAVLQMGKYGEADARVAFKQLLQALEYLHAKGVAHRDLKLENLMLVDRNNISHIKVVDFGLAKDIAAGGQLSTVCGTPQYVAPEVISGGRDHVYGAEVDLWSAGVVLFVLLSGYPPFYNQNQQKLFDIIRHGKWSFNDPVWNSVSDSAKDLVSKLLVVDPKQRLSAKQALQHPWIVGGQGDADLSAAAKTLARTHNRRFKRAVYVVMGMNRMNRLQQNAQAGRFNSIDYDAAARGAADRPEKQLAVGQ